MPLSRVQGDILRLLASQRDQESFVAGSTPINRNAPRYSNDIDIFHDSEVRLARAVQQDTAILQECGYSLKWIRQQGTMHAALVEQGDETTKLEWVVDSDFRFFPAMRDEVFG